MAPRRTSPATATATAVAAGTTPRRSTRSRNKVGEQVAQGQTDAEKMDAAVALSSIAEAVDPDAGVLAEEEETPGRRANRRERGNDRGGGRRRGAEKGGSGQWEGEIPGSLGLDVPGTGPIRASLDLQSQSSPGRGGGEGVQGNKGTPEGQAERDIGEKEEHATTSGQQELNQGRSSLGNLSGTTARDSGYEWELQLKSEMGVYLEKERAQEMRRRSDKPVSVQKPERESKHESGSGSRLDKGGRPVPESDEASFQPYSQPRSLLSQREGNDASCHYRSPRGGDHSNQDNRSPSSEPESEPEIPLSSLSETTDLVIRRFAPKALNYARLERDRGSLRLRTLVRRLREDVSAHRVRAGGRMRRRYLPLSAAAAATTAVVAKGGQGGEQTPRGDAGTGPVKIDDMDACRLNFAQLVLDVVTTSPGEVDAAALAELDDLFPLFFVVVREGDRAVPVEVVADTFAIGLEMRTQALLQALWQRLAEHEGEARSEQEWDHHWAAAWEAELEEAFCIPDLTDGELPLKGWRLPGLFDEREKEQLPADGRWAALVRERMEAIAETLRCREGEQLGNGQDMGDSGDGEAPRGRPKAIRAVERLEARFAWAEFVVRLAAWAGERYEEVGRWFEQGPEHEPEPAPAPGPAPGPQPVSEPALGPETAPTSGEVPDPDERWTPVEDSESQTLQRSINDEVFALNYAVSLMHQAARGSGDASHWTNIEGGPRFEHDRQSQHQQQSRQSTPPCTQPQAQTRSPQVPPTPPRLPHSPSDQPSPLPYEEVDVGTGAGVEMGVEAGGDEEDESEGGDVDADAGMQMDVGADAGGEGEKLGHDEDADADGEEVRSPDQIPSEIYALRDQSPTPSQEQEDEEEEEEEEEERQQQQRPRRFIDRQAGAHRISPIGSPVSSAFESPSPSTSDSSTSPEPQDDPELSSPASRKRPSKEDTVRRKRIRLQHVPRQAAGTRSETAPERLGEASSPVKAEPTLPSRRLRPLQKQTPQQRQQPQGRPSLALSPVMAQAQRLTPAPPPRLGEDATTAAARAASAATVAAVAAAGSKNGRDREAARTPAPTGRRAWTEEETGALIELIGMLGPRWADIKRADDRSERPRLARRGQVNLKDKARQLAVGFYRSREPLPRNFEHIRIQTSSRLELEKEGIRVLQE